MIEIIKEYFGQEDEAIVTEALNNNVIVFSLSENQSKVLRELLHFLESYIGKEGVKDIILNKPSSFSIFRIKTQKKSNGVKIYILQLPLVVKYLESYIERESVQNIMKNSFKGLAMAEHKKLKTVVTYIENYFENKDKGKKVVQGIIKNNFQGLAIAEREKLKDVIEYIEGYFENNGKAVVQEIMQKSFYGLAIAEVDKLQSIVRYIEKYTDTKNERKIIIRQIMVSINLFAKTSNFNDESRNTDFIFEKLNDVLKSIDTSIQSTNYDLETKKIWKKRLQNIFLNFSLESLEELHQDINNETPCREALS